MCDYILIYRYITMYEMSEWPFLAGTPDKVRQPPRVPPPTGWETLVSLTH